MALLMVFSWWSFLEGSDFPVYRETAEVLVLPACRRHPGRVSQAAGQKWLVRSRGARVLIPPQERTACDATGEGGRSLRGPWSAVGGPGLPHCPCPPGPGVTGTATAQCVPGAGGDSSAFTTGTARRVTGAHLGTPTVCYVHVSSSVSISGNPKH